MLRLRHMLLVGAVSCGRAGLGSSTTPGFNKAQGKDRRLLKQTLAARTTSSGLLAMAQD